MKAIWDRIHSWLSANAPLVFAGLRPGATEEAIRAAEAEMGVSFPEDVKASYRLHDGCEQVSFLDGWVWHGLNEMLGDWRLHRSLLEAGGGFAGTRGASPGDPIRDNWWHTGWIPLTMDWGGNCHCLDLAPAPGGDVGQIFIWDHESSASAVLDRGFGDWLSRFADQLEAGVYVYSEDRFPSGLARADEL